MVRDGHVCVGFPLGMGEKVAKLLSEGDHHLTC